MTANNTTSAHEPLQPVAEKTEVVLSRILGLVERDGQGVFVQTEKGIALQTLLDNTPPEKQDEVAKAFLFPPAGWNVLRGVGILKI